MNIISGRLKFDPQRHYTGAALNDLFGKLIVAVDDVEALKALEGLAGVELKLQVRETRSSSSEPLRD